MHPYELHTIFGLSLNPTDTQFCAFPLKLNSRLEPVFCIVTRYSQLVLSVQVSGLRKQTMSLPQLDVLIRCKKCKRAEQRKEYQWNVGW